MTKEGKSPVARFAYDLGDGSRLIVVRHAAAMDAARRGLLDKPNVGFSSMVAKGLLVGYEPWSLGRERDGEAETVGVGVYASGTLNSFLNVSVFVHFGVQHAFWIGLLSFANSIGATRMLVEQFRADLQQAGIPALKGEFHRYSDVKLYVWDLARDSWDASVSSNHRRNIGRARRHGVELVSLPYTEAIGAHLNLIGASLKRRSFRGEPTNLVSDADQIQEVLRTGQTELFQAAVDDEVVSSKLVYTLGPFAYYHSGGTSKRGMTIGASHYLMYSLTGALRERGIASLDLDVASVAAGGLARYKADFGAEQWLVERVQCDLRSPAKLVRNAWHNALEFLSRTDKS